MSIVELTPASRNIAPAPAHSFWSVAGESDGYGALNFDRCVDWLLDLYQTTTDQALHSLVADVLNELRSLGPVEGEFEEVVLAAVASVETAFIIKGQAR